MGLLVCSDPHQKHSDCRGEKQAKDQYRDQQLLPGHVHSSVLPVFLNLPGFPLPPGFFRRRLQRTLDGILRRHIDLYRTGRRASTTVFAYILSVPTPLEKTTHPTRTLLSSFVSPPRLAVANVDGGDERQVNDVVVAFRRH